jgi:hypothetical protein
MFRKYQTLAKHTPVTLQTTQHTAVRKKKLDSFAKSIQARINYNTKATAVLQKLLNEVDRGKFD